jgi:hypothetical protein
MKTAVYARVSTTNGQDPEMQLRELRDYCQRRGWEVGQEYVDTGISGTKEKRPELDRLLTDVSTRWWYGGLTGSPARFHTYCGHSKPSGPWALSLFRYRNRWTLLPLPAKWSSPSLGL